MRRALIPRCLVLLVAVAGCEGSHSKIPDSTSSTVITDSADLADTSKTVSTTVAMVEPMGGPDIVVDSGVGSPSMESQNHRYVLRLPAPMAAVLFDTLPRFKPLPDATYGIPPPDESGSSQSALVGDFDGDSRQDLAMLGKVDTTSVFVILLAADSSGKPHIILVDRATPQDGSIYHLRLWHPQKIASPDNEDYILDLHTDAIYMVGGESAQLCYLDHGKVQYFSLTGD
jgi:hypothetical protein